MTRSEQLALRRRDLQLQCALQRQQLAHLARDIESRLTMTDRIIAVVSRVSTIARNPLALIAAIGVTSMLGPWRLTKWVTQAAVIFRVARRVQQFMAK